MKLCTDWHNEIQRSVLNRPENTRASGLNRWLFALSLAVAFQSTLPATGQICAPGQICEPKCDPPVAPPFVCRKGPVVCKAGQWAPGPPLPAGTQCLVGGREGKCSESSECIGLPPGPSGNFEPQYLLLALTYAPPGNDSTTAYTEGNAVGTVNSLSNALGNAVTVTVATEGIYFSGSFSLTAQNGTQYTFTKTTGVTLGTMPNPSPPPNSDTVDHNQDTFWVWLKPKMHYIQTYQGVPNVQMNFLADQPAIVPYPLTVAQILGKTPDSEKIMDGWTAADKASLLNQDPFLRAGYQPVGERFVFVQQVVVHGPSAPGGPIPYTIVSIGYSGQNCDQDQVVASNSISIGGNLTVGLGAVTSLQAYDTITNTETYSKSKCDQLSQTLAWTPASTTPYYNERIGLYMDNLYGTLAYVDLGPDNASSTDSAVISGTIKGINRKPVKFGQVNLLLADGVRRTLVSDENGRFQSSVPAGPLTVKAGATEKKVVLERGKTVSTLLQIDPPMKREPSLR